MQEAKSEAGGDEPAAVWVTLRSVNELIGGGSRALDRFDPPVFTPLLTNEGDARRSSLRLFPPESFPYLALMLGGLVTGVCAIYNAVALRRTRPALIAAVLGIGGWVGFGALAVALANAGVRNYGLWLLAARLLSLGVGLLIARSQWAHVRGHSFLDGATLPLMPMIIGGLALNVVLPGRVLLVLEGLWPLLLQ